MDYMDTIRRGLEITWKNKFLWVLGFLAALGSGSSFSNSNYSFNSGDSTFLQNWLTPERAAALTAGLIGFACVAFIIGIILWVISLSARGGLIAAVAQMETGTGKPTLGSSFRHGWRRVLRLIGLTILLFIIPVLLVGIVVGALIVPVAAGFAYSSGSSEPSAGLLAGMGGAVLLFCCLLIGIGLLAFVLSLVYAFAFRGIILRNMGVIDSMRHGWQVLRDNLGKIIMLGLAFFLINIAILIVVAAILVPVGLIVGVPLVMLGQTDATFLQGLLAALGILVGLIITAAISAIITAWQSSTFTIAYLQWTGKDIAIEA